VCAWTEKIPIKPLETVGVVRDNALTREVKFYFIWTVTRLLDRFADLRQSSKVLRIFSNLEVQQRGMIMISS